MKKPKYTKEEREIIKRWGIPSDKDFDTTREAYSADGDIRVTSLILAKHRQAILEKRGKTLVRSNRFKKTS